MAKITSDYRIERVINDTDPLATGAYQIAKVPADEFWEIFAVYVSRSFGATLTANNLEIYDVMGVMQMPVKSQTASATLLMTWEKPLPVGPGWLIKSNVNAYNAGDKLTAKIFYKRTKYWGPVTSG
jgi:hypothetical protein